MKQHKRKRQALLLAVWMIAQNSGLRAQRTDNYEVGGLPAEGEIYYGIHKDQDKQRYDADSKPQRQDRLRQNDQVLANGT